MTTTILAAVHRGSDRRHFPIIAVSLIRYIL